MSYFKRRDLFFVALAASLIVLYFIFGVSIYSVGWATKIGIVALTMVLYQSIVQLPSIGDELEKQKEINEKLNEKLIELRDKVKYKS